MQKERLIAIGDIHGCFHTLKKLLEEVQYNKYLDTLVFVGDYIDRGLYSYEVVRFLRGLQEEVGEDRCICLKGNHEDMAVNADGHAYNEPWSFNGSRETAYSYERNQASIQEDLEWFANLPTVYDTPELIFCHAGLTSPKLQDNTSKDLLWGREWILRDKRPREKQVIFGHTPNKKGAYQTASGDLCIDGGCVFAGNLCAVIFSEDSFNYINLAQDVRDTYLLG